MMLPFFSESAFGQSRVVSQSELVNQKRLPYVLVGDEIFPLKTWFMKPILG